MKQVQWISSHAMWLYQIYVQEWYTKVAALSPTLQG